MRSGIDGAGSADLTARARIRDAAIRRFGTAGFGAPIRVIAADAGVSPGLVIHHFGSKDALRAACDEHVLRVLREAKTETLVRAGPGDVLAQLATVAEYGPVAGYLVQALGTGGALGAALLEQAIADAQDYLEQGVAAGRVRPSRDPAARARYLAYAGVGALLLYVRQHPGDDLGETLTAYTREAALPALELHTEGLLSDSSLLDAYLSSQPGPPGAVVERP